MKPILLSLAIICLGCKGSAVNPRPVPVLIGPPPPPPRMVVIGTYDAGYGYARILRDNTTGKEYLLVDRGSGGVAICPMP